MVKNCLRNEKNTQSLENLIAAARHWLGDRKSRLSTVDLHQMSSLLRNQLMHLEPKYGQSVTIHVARRGCIQLFYCREVAFVLTDKED